MLAANRPGVARSERILVVDDDQRARDDLVGVLADRGYQVAAFGDGGEALAAYETCAPHAVITDLRVPGLPSDELIRRIRSRAPNARIVTYNVPNSSALPYVSRNTITERGVLQRIAVGLADRVNAAAGPNVLVVDLLCEPRVYEAGSVSSDGFHPSDQGYRLMADLAYPALSNGSAATPSASCPQRTVVPVF